MEKQEHPLSEEPEPEPFALSVATAAESDSELLFDAPDSLAPPEPDSPAVPLLAVSVPPAVGSLPVTSLAVESLSEPLVKRESLSPPELADAESEPDPSGPVSVEVWESTPSVSDPSEVFTVSSVSPAVSEGRSSS